MVSIIIALPPFLGSFHVMLCNSADLNLTSATCKGGFHNVIEVIIICLACGFSVATLFNMAQVRFFARFREPFDTESRHCMPDFAEKVIAVISIAVRCVSYAAPTLLAHEQDINFASISIILIGYIFAVAYKGWLKRKEQQQQQQQGNAVWWRPVRHLLGALCWVCLMRIWKPIIVPHVVVSDNIPAILCVISVLLLIGFTYNLLRQERQFLRYGFVAFLSIMAVGYGALVYTVLADPEVDLWPLVLCSGTGGILYAALWTFFPGTKAPRTSYVTFHIAAVLCLVAPLPVLLFVHFPEEAPLVLLVVLVCYHLGRFVYLADLSTYNSHVVLYRTLLLCTLAKFASSVMSGNDVTSLFAVLSNLTGAESLLDAVRLLARVYAGPIVVFSFSVVSVYQIARNQGSNGPNMFEQGALVACLTIFCAYVCGPAVVAGAAFVLRLRDPMTVWGSYGPKMLGVGGDAVFGVVVCVAFAVFSVVNRSFIIKTERERRRISAEEAKQQEELKKTQ